MGRRVYPEGQRGCYVCKQVKPVAEFPADIKHKHSYRCRACKVSYDVANAERYYDRNRHHLLEYLQTHPCVDCGEPDPIVLEFDHVRGTKDFNLAEAPFLKTSVERIDEEISKCEVRCANCHARVTAQRRGSWKVLTHLLKGNR